MDGACAVNSKIQSRKWKLINYMSNWWDVAYCNRCSSCSTGWQPVGEADAPVMQKLLNGLRHRWIKGGAMGSNSGAFASVITFCFPKNSHLDDTISGCKTTVMPLRHPNSTKELTTFIRPTSCVWGGRFSAAEKIKRDVGGWKGEDRKW